MNKFFLSVVAIFAFGIMSAQEINYGIKAGFNLAYLAGESEGVHPIAGFHAGGFVEFKLTDKFSLQPEVLYSMQGAEMRAIVIYNDVNFTSESKARLNYINVPVMAKFYVVPRFSIEAGPQIGFLTSAKEETSFDFLVDNQMYNTTEKYDIKNTVKTVDFALNIGAGFEFTKNIFAQARYNFGLTRVNDDNSRDLKNSVLQISLGYKF